MKLNKNYVWMSLIGAFLSINLACGGTSSTSSNANNSNTNAVPKDTSPLTITASEFKSKDHIGRAVTISEVELRGIYNTSLDIKADLVEINCVGDFSSYIASADRVKELRTSGKSPKATIKGVYKEYENGKAKIEPCALIDLEK